MIQDQASAEYRCPGENYSISRSIHLGRLTSFYGPCRHCPHRDDTAGLSARQIRQLSEIVSRAPQPPLFCAEGVANVAINDLSPDLARRLAAEFARRLTSPKSRDGSAHAVVIIASDGRLATAAIIAAIVEGVRWTGCEVVDIGPASAPCTARSIEHLCADGGVLVGNAGGAPHTIGLKFWAHGEPLSQGGLLDEVAAGMRTGAGEATIDRPTRTFGPIRHFAAAEPYLADLRPAYHALRPLRFALDCAAGPVEGYLNELLRSVACRIIPGEGRTDRLGRQVVDAQAHFGIWIEDDGENCRVFDERGQLVEATHLLALIAGNLSGPVTHGHELRQQTFLSMQESGAAIAADRAGRLWYAAGYAPLPDALQTLTHLLVLLSRDDRAFSWVLDQKAPAV